MLKTLRKLTGIPEWLLLFLLVLPFACRRPVRVVMPENGREQSQGRMEKVNEFLVEKDEEVIRNFVSRMGWEMELTESGLWYMVGPEGDGPELRPGTTVIFDYSISLLDGTLCYSSEEDGSRTVRIGYSGEVRGLEEGLLLLRVGDHARFIMPPHLAHGLVGDGERIPARATLVYEVVILAAEN